MSADAPSCCAVQRPLQYHRAFSGNERVSRDLQKDKRYAIYPTIVYAKRGLTKLHISTKLQCVKTGTYTVCLNEDHFKDLLFENILPPAALKPSALSIAKGDTTASRNTNVNAADLMIMGFPTLQKQSQHPTLCACHSKLYKSKGYICPRCSSKLCEVPTECVVCRLTIVSSPHLARSYRHLFPVSNWKEVNGLNGSDEMPSHCFGCNVKFPPFAEATGAPPTARSEGVTSRTSQTITGEITASTSVTGNISPTGRYQCPKCTRMFCIDCDIFVHQLGACPGCQ